MGTILTSYGDAGYDHEGYAAQVLDDGTLTSEYSDQTEPRMVGAVVAACGCGWTGTTRYPTRETFDEDAQDLALDEWEHDHARPVLRQVQQVELRRLRKQLRWLAESWDSGWESITSSPIEEQAAGLANLARELEVATQRAWRLHHQYAEQADQAGRGPGGEDQS